MKRISIIIVTYNSENDIYDCVESIKTYTDIPKENIELIVVDNCSREPQPMFERLRRQWGEGIILIENDKNGGYGQGNNVGIRQATAPVLLIMNPDVRLMEPIFNKPLQAFHEDEQLIMYGMKMMNTPTQASQNSFWCTTMMNGYARTLLTGLCTRLDWFWPRWMHFSGSCFFIRKAMFEAVGLFDEEVFMYGEEDDIHYRLAKRFGYHFRYDKGLHYIHPMHERVLTIDYEKRLLEVDLYRQGQRGIPARKTLKTYLQINNVLLLRDNIKKILGHDNSGQQQVLQTFRQYVKQKMRES